MNEQWSLCRGSTGVARFSGQGGLYALQRTDGALRRGGKARRVGVPMNKELSDQVEYTVELMESIIDDTTVPRNIRKATEDARIKLMGDEKELNVNISNAIYLMEDISNDINMPAHTRTEIWTIISELESIREKSKG